MVYNFTINSSLFLFSSANTLGGISAVKLTFAENNTSSQLGLALDLLYHTQHEQLLLLFEDWDNTISIRPTRSYLSKLLSRRNRNAMPDCTVALINNRVDFLPL